MEFENVVGVVVLILVVAGFISAGRRVESYVEEQSEMEKGGVFLCGVCRSEVNGCPVCPACASVLGWDNIVKKGGQ